ncbi:MAG: AAA family ATPase [Deltaproteobacteria bacterium]|nr:AAA family ATPase [Deltaproteobacteria bacterium]
MLTSLEVEGYRSLQKVRCALGPITVVVGPNGSGKSNLYQSLKLVHAAAQGTLARVLAAEGGMPSILWAGARKEGPRRVTLRAHAGQWSYALELGLPVGDQGSMFALDPLIKSERAWMLEGSRRHVILERVNHSATARDSEGGRSEILDGISQSESVLGTFADPQRFPMLARLRQEILRWRFYHQLRVDSDAPARRACTATRTPVLSDDGADLASALQTIRENGDGNALDRAIARALQGSQIQVESSRGQLSLELVVPGVARPLAMHEWSDGTLRMVLLLTALNSPRPPTLLALNEPESSLHPDVLPALGTAILEAARHTQLWVTTHALGLAHAVSEQNDTRFYKLHMGTQGSVLTDLHARGEDTDR